MADKTRVERRRIRSAYDGQRVPVVVRCTESLTRQSAAAECDINGILARFAKTGVFTHVNPGQGIYVDVSKVGDYQSALASVARAEELFAALPAKVRKRFENDAAAFLDFCSKPENQAEGAELGLWPKVPEEKPPEKPAEKVPASS